MTLSARAVTIAYVVTHGSMSRSPRAGSPRSWGRNACGKSTLLRAPARMLKPREGSVLLDGVEIRDRSSRAGSACWPGARSRRTASRSSTRGHPHQSFLRRWSRDDERAVQAAMDATRLSDLAERPVDELSGGQRQRAWLARALAQETPLLLLDAPTTFLDLQHQIEVLDLCAEMHVEGRTLVAVLHDQARRCATHLIAMREGAVVVRGRPADVVDAGRVRLGVRCRVIEDPET